MSEVLPSWNDTPVKEAIRQFVAAASDPASLSFVPAPARIAALASNGTLWPEKPYSMQLDLAARRLREMAEQDPALRANPLYQGLWVDSAAYLAGLADDVAAQVNLIFETSAGMTQPEFNEQVRAFFDTARHPRFGVPYTQLAYQPMQELVQLLHDHGFKVFIVTDGGMSFVRLVSEEVCGIPRERVIGSNITFKYRRTKDGPVLARRPGLVEPLAHGPGKPVNIELHVGRPPILAVGNANGDLEMFEYTSAQKQPTLCLLLRHDDAAREYQYDAGAEQIQIIAPIRRWTVVSMKDDFKRVFAFEQP